MGRVGTALTFSDHPKSPSPALFPLEDHALVWRIVSARIFCTAVSLVAELWYRLKCSALQQQSTTKNIEATPN
jgi:hypothetical protein